MKINQDYLKDLLEAFEASDTPTTDIENLNKLGFDCQDENFIFHLKILKDQRFIEGEKAGNLGYIKNAKNEVSWVVTPLRLTAQGHEFIEALQNGKVWDTIKSEFTEASIGTLWKVSKDLLEGYTKKKIEGLIGN